MSKSKKKYGATSAIYKNVFLKMKQSKESDIIDMINKEMGEDFSSTIDNPPKLDEIEILSDSCPEEEPEPVIRKRTRGRKCKKTRANVVPQNIDLLDEVDMTHDLEINYEGLYKPVEPTPSTSLLPKDDSFNLDDAIDDEFKIIVIWKTFEKKSFMFRKHQKLRTIFEHYAQKDNVSPDRIYFFTSGNQPLCPDDTPNSLNFFSIEHIEGGVLNSSSNVNTDIRKKQTQKNKENMLELKLLIKDQRKPILVYMDKKEKMKSIMLQGAEELKKSIDELKFHFDGDLINPSDTPEDLELEGGEVIEITIKS